MKIINIKKVRPRTVYAIKTSTETFISDGLFHHNCAGCNTFKHGNLGIYAVNLIKQYGQKAVDDLIFRSNQVEKLTEEDYQSIIDKYTQKVKELKEPNEI